MTYTRTGLNYTGNKYRLLPQIEPIISNKGKVFVDLFGGAGVVGANVKGYEKIVYNEIDTKIYDIVKMLNQEKGIVQKIEGIVASNSLDRENREAFMVFRDKYNESEKTKENLYVLACHSFSNQIEFNQEDKFNIPFGRRTFNRNQKAAIARFQEKKNIEFKNLSFENVEVTSDCFVYADPPYFGTDTTYNRRRVGGWGIEEENRLRNYLIELDKKGIKWALSNELIKNSTLRDWAEENSFNIRGINWSYSTCSYQRESSQTQEVLITNF